MVTLLLVFAMALVVGFLGSLLGIGGGVLIIPLLTLLFGVPIKTAIGASIVSGIATSSAASAVYVGHGMTHTRLAMVLAPTCGAPAGGIPAVLGDAGSRFPPFRQVLLHVVLRMRRLPQDEGKDH